MPQDSRTVPGSPIHVDGDIGDPLGIAGVVVNGRLQLEHAVAEGGFGVVYRARHLELDRPVAVKCLKAQEGLTSDADRERFVQRFREEAQVTHDLASRSAAIVRVLDVSSFVMPSGLWLPFMVLEWLDGETLDRHAVRWRERLGRNPSLAEVLALLDPIAQALAVAHRTGVAHRDLKPGNVFVCDPAGEPAVKLLDFGVAKAFADEQAGDATTRTPANLFAFTPSYGAPEQFERSLGATGPWTDVFALSLVVVELLSGASALEGETAGELCVSATSPAERPTPRARGARVSSAVEGVFARALAVRPQDRIRDVGTLWGALKEALEAPDDSAEARGAAGSAGASPEGEHAAVRIPAPAARATPAGAAPQRSRAGLAIAGAIVVAGVAVAIGIAVGPGSTGAAASAAPVTTAPPSAPPPATTAAAPVSATVAAPPPRPTTCSLTVGARVIVEREPAADDWADLPASRRFPGPARGYADTVATVEGIHFSPARAPHLLLPCSIAKEATP